MKTNDFYEASINRIDSLISILEHEKSLYMLLMNKDTQKINHSEGINGVLPDDDIEEPTKIEEPTMEPGMFSDMFGSIEQIKDGTENIKK